MKRRNFLLFKTEPEIRTVEFSCRQLHMHFLERRAACGSASDEDFDAAEGGEPATVFRSRTTEQLFENLRRDLDGADLLRVTGHRWLSEGDDELQREFGKVISSFRAGGGRVEFG